MHAETWFMATPNDTWWSRGSAPFVAGETSQDEAVFPPTPLSFQGLVRTRLLAATGKDPDRMTNDEVKGLVGPPDRLPENVRLRGPFPAQRADGGWRAWFVVPRHLVAAAGGPQTVRVLPRTSGVRAGRIHAGAARSGVANSGELPDTRRGGPMEGWIDEGNLAWALTGQAAWDPRGWTERSDPDAQGAVLPGFVHEEVRTGIQVNRVRGAPEDGMLYTARQHRYADHAGLLGAWCAAAEASGLTWGAAPAARKGRLVAFQRATPSKRLEDLLAGRHLDGITARPVSTPLHVWVTLLTPAIATDDAVPWRAVPGTTLILGLGQAGDPIGGFDRRSGRARPVRATWAAGSSWLFALEGPAEARLAAARALHGLDPTLLTEDERFGFGQRLVGFPSLDGAPHA